MSQQQPQQQGPEYRSVKMASPAMPPPLRSPFSVQQTPKPSPMQVSLNHASFPPKQSSSSTTTTNNTSKPWTLCNPLPSVPAGYMLERNQIHISSSNKPQEIANRVSECLHLRSFFLTETSSDIKNAFRAESSKGLLFRVNFFQQQQQQQDSSSDLTIEFQRLNGCSYEFQKTFQAIHRCVFHQSQEEETKQELEFPTCVLPIATREEKLERLLDTFQIAMDMLNSPRIDCQLMGLEVLEPMSTNSEIVSLLFCQEENLSTLLHFCKGSEEPLSQLEQQQECLLKRRALSILANALESSSSNKNNNDDDNNNTIILDALLTCLKNNNNKYGDAHQSFPVARCLVVLSSPSSKTTSQEQLSLAVSLLLAKEQEKQQHLPLFLKQEYQKLEASMLSSSSA